MLQTHARLLGRKESGSGLRPFDEDDRVLEVLLEVSPLRVRHTVEPIEVEVGDVNRPRVPMPDRVRRARHRALHPQCARRPADEGRLAGAELSLDEHDVTGNEPLGQAGGDSLGLLGRAGLELGHGLQPNRVGSE